MFGARHTPIANDNEAPSYAPMGDNVGHRAVWLEKRRKMKAAHASKTGEISKSVPLQKLRAMLTYTGARLILFLWPLLFGGLIYSYIDSALSNTRLILAFALIWVSIASAIVLIARKKEEWVETAILTALIGFVSLIYSNMNMGSIFIYTLDFIAVLNLGAVMISLLTRSPIALLVSLCASIIWVILLFHDYLSLYIPFFVYPFILSGQIWLAAHLKSYLSTLLCVIAAYIGLAHVGYNLFQLNILSSLSVSALFTIIGIAYFQIGNTMHRYQKFGAHIHAVAGALLIIIPLTALGFYFVVPSQSLFTHADVISPLGLMTWNATLGLTLLCVTICFYLQWRKGYTDIMSWAVFLLIYIFIATYMINRPDHLSLIPAFEGREGDYWFGLLLVASAISSSLILTIKGLKYNYSSSFIAGSVVAILTSALIYAKIENDINSLLYMGAAFSLIFAALLSLSTPGERRPYDVRRPQALKVPMDSHNNQALS